MDLAINDDDRFHLVKDKNYKKDVINVVIGVEVTEELEKACLEGYSVYLVHDTIMLQNISTTKSKDQLSDWREIAKWMTWNSHPLKDSQKYKNLEEFMQTEEAKAFLAQDYELE